MTKHLTKPIRAIHFMVLAFLMTVGTQVSAHETAKDCVKVTNAIERLVCFDEAYEAVTNIGTSAAGQTGDDVTTPSTSALSNWRFQKNIDSFTDSNKSYLALERISGSMRGSDAPDTLILRCDGEGSFDIYMVVDGYIGNDAAKVRYRFEGKDAVSSSWDISVDGKAVFDVPWTKPGKFVLELLSGNDFLFEVTDYRGVKNSAEFDNSLDPNFDYILSGCAS